MFREYLPLCIHIIIALIIFNAGDTVAYYILGSYFLVEGFVYQFYIKRKVNRKRKHLSEKGNR
jgi:hypothetical protein